MPRPPNKQKIPKPPLEIKVLSETEKKHQKLIDEFMKKDEFPIAVDKAKGKWLNISNETSIS